MPRTQTTANAFPAARHDHAGCVTQALRTAARLCRARGARLTQARRRVLELVWSGHQPLGAYAILDRLRAEGMAAQPPTVYRALDFLRAQGLVHRIASRNAYVGCRRPDEPHAGEFLLCTACGDAAEILDGSIGDAIAARARQAGFEVQDPTVEIAGLCPRCRGGSRP